MKMVHCILFAAILVTAGCFSRGPEPRSNADPAPSPRSYPSIGGVERIAPGIDRLIPEKARIERLAEGFDWSEGPVWIRSQDALLFSDVPRNMVYKWTESDGAVPFLEPSGYTGEPPVPSGGGSNGLTFDPQGRFVLAQHGDRRIARFSPEGQFEELAAYYNWLRLNSPNDLVYKSNGDLYFTDPPYGLPKGNDDPEKELAFNGVFRLQPNGELTLLTAELTYPNGIAFSPDEKTLYVAVSDPMEPRVMAYPVQEDGGLGSGALFFDAAPLKEGRKGLPDGLKVDVDGNVFATGPGGVLVLDPSGRRLGTVNPGEATSNCAWGNDGSVLYMTADMYLCRIQTSTMGFGF